VYYVHGNKAVTGDGREAPVPGLGVRAQPGLKMASSLPPASALIREMAQGQLAALERFYDRHIQLVYNLVLRIVRNRADAEEVVQEVFLQAWRGADRYDPSRGTPQAWLVTLARTRAIDALRAARRGGQRIECSVTNEIADPGKGDAARLPERQEVTGALGELSSAQRELLELAYYEGLTQTEIAARTGLPLGTVKTRIRTGLERLRVALRGKEWVAP
jgi:RNA polymerase sigma-70 factor, ECF subfamily